MTTAAGNQRRACAADTTAVAALPPILKSPKR
jgi:hypothetical protein